MNRSSTVRVLVPALFAAAVLATLAAFVVAQRLKRSGSVLDRVKVTKHFTPDGDGIADHARIRFRLTRPDDADVEIIDQNDDVVRTIAADRPLGSYQYSVFYWDGRENSRVGAPAGVYRLRVVLRDQGRTIVPEKRIILVGRGAGASRSSG